MNRRNLLKSTGLLTAGMIGGVPVFSANRPAISRPKGLTLRLAHLTDIHLDTKNNAPSRFQKCLDQVFVNDIDFVMNGGDTVMAVDYQDITRERVHELWNLWTSNQGLLKKHNVHSCLGNHDMWWAAPKKTDEMYGKDYAIKQLGMPGRYYSFEEANWHFIVLDSNNSPAGSLDEEQLKWLTDDLASTDPNKHILIMSHYPIFAAICQWEGGMHTDYKELLTLFYQHKNIQLCISGHMHLLENLTYNGIQYCCNGSISGYWWGKGDEKSADTYYYKQTPPGFALIDLYEDGRIDNRYFKYKI